MLGVQPAGQPIGRAQLRIGDAGRGQFLPRHQLDHRDAFGSGPTPSRTVANSWSATGISCSSAAAVDPAGLQHAAQPAGHDVLDRQVLRGGQLRDRRRILLAERIGQCAGQYPAPVELNLLLPPLQCRAALDRIVELGHLGVVGLGAAAGQLVAQLGPQRRQHRGTGRAVPHRCDQVGGQRFHLVEEQVFLGVEVVEHGGHRDAGPSRHLGDGDRVEPGGEEELHGRGVDRFPGALLVLLPASHLSGHRAPARTEDAFGGQLAGQQHHRNPDPGLGVGAAEHQVLDAAIQRREAERPGLARTCARRRTARRRPAPGPASPPG